MKVRSIKRLVIGFGGIAALIASFVGGRAFAAGIPDDDVLNYAGTLLAIDGTPVEGEHDIEIQFSASSTGEPLLCTTSAVDTGVTLGRFSVALDDSCVDDVRANPNLYVQVLVDTEAFGWSKIGAVPYAVEAGHATTAEGAESATGDLDDRIAVLESTTLPAGAVMAFDRPTCPAGWSIVSNAQGRTIVGLTPGGTLQGTLGAALSNLEDRAHSHSVDPASATSSVGGSHTHSVDPSNVTSSAVDLSHTHSVDPTAFTLPAHRHSWANYNSTTQAWGTYQANGNSLTLVTWTNGMTNDGSGNYPLEHSPANAGFNAYYTGNPVDTSGSTTAISVDVPATTSGAPINSTNHAHSVNVGPTTSTAGGDHSHDLDLSATTSSAAATSSVIPYIQLLYCKKD
jgi:hypothetical protein